MPYNHTVDITIDPSTKEQDVGFLTSEIAEHLEEDPVTGEEDIFSNYPEIRLDRLQEVHVPLTPTLENNLAGLIGQRLTPQTEKAAIHYLNQAFDQYCATNNIRPANFAGDIRNLRHQLIKHVAHDDTTDSFLVDDTVRRFDIGRNGWISAFTVDRTTGQIRGTYNIADVSVSQRTLLDIPLNTNPVDPTEVHTGRIANATDNTGIFRVIDPANVTVYETRFINGQMEVLGPYIGGENLGESLEYLKLDPIRRKLRNNILVRSKTRADYQNLSGVTPEESAALDTLREMISESDFRKYLSYGFITVNSISGKTYQVFRNRGHIKVWENGQLVEEICVRIADHRVPLTDNVIAFKVALEIDEDGFRSMGNVYNMRKAAA